MDDRPSVLFVCVHNAGRSQMAAGWLRHFAAHRIEIRSAGTEPAERVNPVAVAAMREVGIDIAEQTPIVLDHATARDSDIIITMGCGDTCPYFPGKRYLDWTLDDPAGQPLDAVRRIRDDIRVRVGELVAELLGRDVDFDATLGGMTMDEIISFVEGLGGVLTLRPVPGDGSPEISWGDVFFYYAPDGVVPTRTQPFATIVTKNYPDDEASRLDRPDTFRVNVSAGKDDFVRWTGHAPREPDTTGADPGDLDTVFAHPVYGTVGWLAVLNPGPRTEAATRDLLRAAHEVARSRSERRAGQTPT